MGSEMKLSQAEPEIRDALERLAIKPESSHPFVVVTANHEGRDRFVQFYGSAERGINLDLPVAQFNLSEHMLIVTERIDGPLDGLLEKTTEHGYCHERCTSADGATWAVAILTVLNFPAEADIVIEEHADGTGLA